MNLVDFFTDHTFRMVLFGTVIIGLTGGTIGSFAYLRKQSLISDVISHSALSGTLLAFLVSVTIFNFNSKNSIILTAGAIVSGTLAALLANWIANHSKIKIDTAMAIVLTLFFGFGLLLMRIISNGEFPAKGGIQDYLFGNASVITTSDLQINLVISLLAITLLILFWKQIVSVTFDREYSKAIGVPVEKIDLLVFSLIVMAIVLGLKAVGLVLMVAFMVTPPAIARQWTDRLAPMTIVSGLVGLLASTIGTYISVSWQGLPTGPVVVLVLFIFFIISIVFSPKRGLVVRLLKQRSARANLILASATRGENS